MKLISDSFANIENIAYYNNIVNIGKDDVFHRYDVFECGQIKQLFDAKGKPAIFISDHIIHFDDFIDDVKFIGLPLWLEKKRQEWNLDEFENTKYKTSCCFNFMINKKQINRYLCIKLVELFQLKCFVYTWSGADNRFDCSEIIQEHELLDNLSPLSLQQFSEILSPIRLQPNFYSGPGHKNMQHDGCRMEVQGTDRNPWDWGLCKNFSESAVSLITESLNYQKASVFTEKTLFSLLGLTFPIWVGGGAKQAEIWKKIGFDIFDDVINHDYQYYDTLLERCCYAFILNEKILTNLDYAKSIRDINIDRLKNNRNLILTGNLRKYIHNELGTSLYTNYNFENSLKKSFDQLLKEFKIDN